VSPLWRGTIEALCILGAFLGFGLGWAAVEAEVAAAAAPYAPVVTQEATHPPRVWLVDGYNVLCAGLLGGRQRGDWWNEAHRLELLERLERFEEAEAEIWVVFDGARDPGAALETNPRIRLIFAPSADEWLVEQVRARAAGVEVAVVTADRRLAGRARRRGAQVVSPRAFLGRCSG
jgi:predicted RNA-binding protein with PIN domain